VRGRGGRLGIRPSLFVFLGLTFAASLPGPVRDSPAAVGFTAGPLSAQEGPAGTVIGRIIEAGTGLPQVGAFVALLDPDGERRAAVLTDEGGRYVLRVPAPGRYRLRVEGLGVASTFGEYFDFAAGEVREEHLEIQAAALSIEGLEVTGAAQCDLSSGDGSTTVRLWDEARKALEVAQWIDEIGYVYDITNFRRELAADGETVIWEQETPRTLLGQSPFVSIEAETLMAEGFVVQDSLGYEYYGPDAAVLLSDVFLSGHCFEAVREDGQLGLAFYPRDGRRIPDIEGTLWFAGEGVLDRLEYSYTGISEYDNDDAVGGEVEFRRLPQGAWIVQEWAIRMPAATVESLGGRPPRLVRIRETGAVVRDARGIARVGATISEGTGAVLGKVLGAADPGPEAGRVYLSGTSHRAVPGPDGSFLLEGVQPGGYDLVVEHPQLGAVGEGPRTHRVRIHADSIVSVEVVLPTR